MQWDSIKEKYFQQSLNKKGPSIDGPFNL